jgi:hypothetical protein
VIAQIKNPTCCVFLDVCSRVESSTLGETTPEAVNITTTTTRKIISVATTNVTSTMRPTTAATVSSTLATIKTTTRPTTTPAPPPPTTAPTTSSTTLTQRETTRRKTTSDFVEIEDEHDMMLEEDDDEIEPGNITNEKFINVQSQMNVSTIITTLVIAVSSVFFAIIAISIVYKQYKKSTNPLNYKERSENGSKRADEEFSEIRYLTSDEALDFALATPDNFTDL